MRKRRDDLRARAREALAPLGLHRSQKREAWEAFQEAPDEVERLAAEAQSGTPASPAAIFLAAIRRGDHRQPPREVRKRPTGWRHVRGSHGSTYKRDPLGTDSPPKGYDTETRSPIRSEEEDDGVERITYDEYLRRRSSE